MQVDDEDLVNQGEEIADENLVNPATKLAHEILVNVPRDLDDESETVIGVVNVMVNPTINIAHVNFDEELLANDEWL